MAVSDHLGRGGRHLLQTVQGGGGLHGLDRSQYGVHGDNRQNDNRALHVPQDGGDDGGHNQNDDQKIRELLQENAEHTLPVSSLQFVGAVLLQPPGGLRRRQALPGAVQLPEQLHPVLLPHLVHTFHPFRQDAKRRGLCVNALH